MAPDLLRGGSKGRIPGVMMRYLIVRTDVREPGLDVPVRTRDERRYPETRRQVASAVDRDSALRMARALAACGAVRAGRQRVKVIRLGF
jgi:hypothetical protein